MRISKTKTARPISHGLKMQLLVMRVRKFGRGSAAMNACEDWLCANRLPQRIEDLTYDEAQDALNLMRRTLPDVGDPAQESLF